MKEHLKVPRHILKFMQTLKEYIVTVPGIDSVDLIHVLVNPSCGHMRYGISHLKLTQRLRKLRQQTNQSQAGQKRPEIHFTVSRSLHHAREIFLKIVGNHSEEVSAGRLILLIGGDGFNWKIRSTMIENGIQNTDKLNIVTLPLGSGNDLSKARDLSEGLDMIRQNLPGHGEIQAEPYVEITLNTAKVYYAFNVVSFGMDADIVALSERFRKIFILPGIYKFFTNITILFHSLFHPLRPWNISIESSAEKIIRAGKYLLNVFCPTGNRTYGGGVKMMPREENYMLVEPLSLLKRIQMKPLFYDGRHYDLPIAEFFHAEKVELDYDYPIRIQIDGEYFQLSGDDFPLTLRRVAN